MWSATETRIRRKVLNWNRQPQSKDFSRSIEAFKPVVFFVKSKFMILVNNVIRFRLSCAVSNTIVNLLKAIFLSEPGIANTLRAPAFIHQILVESVWLIFLVVCVVLCFCVLFVFVLCLVCPMLPLPLDCSLLIASSLPIIDI